MTSLFDPMLVPKGTLKTLAKRMKKHPLGQHLTLSQCQEVIARTFGHSSWHALQSYQRPDRSGQLLGNAKQRLVFYSILENGLREGFCLADILDMTKKAAQRTEQWDWVDTAELFFQDVKAHVHQGESFYQHIAPHSPIEAFLLKQSARANGLIAGLQEAMKFQQQSLKQAEKEQAETEKNHQMINNMVHSPGPLTAPRTIRQNNRGVL